MFLDLNLPDLSGYEVLQSLRTANVNTPVLILSGLASTADKVKGLGFGADDYVTKPFHKDELLARVEAVVRRSQGPTEAVVRCDDLGPCCTDQGWGRNDPDPVRGSCDADGLRASQFQHAVQDLDGDVHLSRPTLIRTRAQPVPDHALEPADGGLGPGARIVARDLLPAHPARLGDEVQVAVPLCGGRLGRRAGHGGRARRDVNALLVVHAVRRGGGDRVRD